MTDEPDKWRVTVRDEIADCSVFEVTSRESIDDDGREATFYVIESPDWVNVIPLTKGGEIVLIEQFRHGSQEITLEIPGGMVDRGETPAECASRELTEETGYIPEELIYLGRSRPNPAIQSNWIHHFAALGCSPDGKQAFDEHEDIKVRTIPAGELDKLISDGEITHSLVLAGILRYRVYSDSLRNVSYES